jgi:type III pantothenate kinase
VDVVNSKREYLGGLIAPGINAGAKALSLAAPKLPEVEIKIPEALVARTTEEAIRSGIVYGHAAMVDGLVGRILEESFSAGEKPHVVATGGHAAMIAEVAGLVSVVDRDLTLKGLRLYFERRQEPS